MQYGSFMARAVRAILAVLLSPLAGLPLVLERMPTTLLLTFLALALAVVIAIPAGI